MCSNIIRDWGSHKFMIDEKHMGYSRAGIYINNEVNITYNYSIYAGAFVYSFNGANI